MSQTRLHDSLKNLFDGKNPSALFECLDHSDFSTFKCVHGLTLVKSELVQAFIHTSFSHEFQVSHQEQLEFLGDSVLQLILTDELYRRFPKEKEGKLSKIRSSIVNEKTLAQIGRGLNLDQLILVGKGEFKKELFKQDPVIADTLEALLGQIYRHQGFEFIRQLFLSWLDKFIPLAFESEFLDFFDAKSKLQEASLAQFKQLPRYQSESQGDKFLVKLFINDKLLGEGLYSSKKAGEKELATIVLKKGLI